VVKRNTVHKNGVSYFWVNCLDDPFPEQEYHQFIGYQGGTGLVGNWTIATAKQIAQQLREEGFNVKLRGRGSRKKYFKETKARTYNSLPLKFASHAAVYIVGEEKEEEIDLQLQAVIECLS
jgi:hypothetical protein